MIHLNLAFHQCLRKPTKTGGIVIYFWGALNVPERYITLWSSPDETFFDDTADGVIQVAVL